VTVVHPLYWREGCLHYTTDGSDPTADSPVFAGDRPIEVNRPTTLKARYVEGAKMGPVAEARYEVTDTTAPRVIRAVSAAGLRQVEVFFSEPVAPASAASLPAYQLGKLGSPLSVIVAADGRSVLLEFAQPLEAPPAPLILRAEGLTDTSPAANRAGVQRVPVEVAVPAVAVAAVHCPEGAREIPLPPLGHAWSLNLFVRTKRPVPNRTLIAGFGSLANTVDGTGHYFAKVAEGVEFWSRKAELGAKSERPLPIGGWHMLTATYDGRNESVYLDGEPIGDGGSAVPKDEPVLRIAPLDPWDQERRFHGDIRNLEFWTQALPPGTVQLLWTAGRTQP
jgi:alpha-mannosidase